LYTALQFIGDRVFYFTKIQKEKKLIVTITYM